MDMLRAGRSVLLAILFMLLMLSPCRAWQGKVVEVLDGDSITVLHDGQGERIRLYGVDSPESGQDFSRKARAFTSDMVLGKTVEVKAFDTDRYRRTVAVIYIESGKCLNEELLRTGLAWFYERFCNRPHCQAWKQIELTAREGKVGLWGEANPMPPWEFKHSGGRAPMTIPTEGGPPAASTLERSPAVPSTGDKPPATTHTQSSGPYHGNTASRVFHQPSCQDYNCKYCIVVFQGREEAIKAGYKPCGMCNP